MCGKAFFPPYEIGLPHKARKTTFQTQNKKYPSGPPKIVSQKSRALIYGNKQNVDGHQREISHRWGQFSFFEKMLA